MIIAVTGGNGFLGSFVVKQLENKYPASKVISIRSRQYNLISRSETQKMYEDIEPDVVVHLAATVGGIGANMVNPGRFFYDNMSMGLNIVDCARIYNLNKLVFVSTVCSYPKFTPAPFLESDMWNGYPEETNAPYGIAKKAIMVMLQGYYAQYGLKSSVLVPTNLYGPNDHFDPKISHVIPALIKKFVDAKNNNDSFVEVWGDGSATREFLYVEDAAEAIVRSIELVDTPDPINLGSGYEINIKDLAEKIRSLVGYPGEIVWNSNKPNGQPRRVLNADRAKQLLYWTASTSFEEGLSKTIQWYKQNTSCAE